MKRKNFLLILLIALAVFSQPLFSKTMKSDEKRFQLGFGLIVSTGNLLGLIENVRMYQAFSAGQPYVYPGLSDKQAQAINDMSAGMRQAIFVANILGSFEYGLEVRVLWHALMVHTDLALLPMDGSYNGRLDFVWSVNAGVRAPFFIMPYITAGVNFTFSWYPGYVTDIRDVESWKGAWGTFRNFSFRPGINIRTGLEIKLKRFSVGVYYKYTIKDFEEFSRWIGALANDFATQNLDNAQARAVGMVFGYQSRFGIALTVYAF